MLVVRVIVLGAALGLGHEELAASDRQSSSGPAEHADLPTDHQVLTFVGMEIVRMRVFARGVKFGALAVAVIGMVVGLTPNQAQAASSISANLVVTQGGSGRGHRTQATIDVHLPMSQD